jgi:hypothetical protein
MREREGWQRIGDYLVARQLLNFAQAELAVAPLRRALDDAAPTPALWSPELVRAARFALVDALVQTRAWDAARTVLDRIEAEPDLRSGHRLDIDLWRERIAFFEEYFAA